MMDIVMIILRDNSTFKNLLKLTQKKHRREQGLCIIEGEKVVREHATDATQIFAREKFPSYMEGCPKGGVVLSAKLFDEVGSLETSQGILAIIPIPKPEKITFPYLVLDGIQDPGNMGTILRTAAAFGFCTVFCINCVDVWSQKVLRASSATQFALNIFESSFEEFKTIFDTDLKDGKLFIADLNGSMNDKPADKFGLVLGNEGRGISDAMKTLPHKTVTIPLEKSVESLNVAVAGGILMYKLQCTNCK